MISVKASMVYLFEYPSHHSPEVKKRKLFCRPVRILEGNLVKVSLKRMQALSTIFFLRDPCPVAEPVVTPVFLEQMTTASAHFL